MSDKIFLDSNIVLYLYSDDVADKKDVVLNVMIYAVLSQPTLSDLMVEV